MRLILTILILTATTFTSAHAGEVYQCGEPDPANLPEETVGMCDIYSRQLEYRISANELREKIKARQLNFQAPAIQARKNYEESIKRLNKERGTQKDEDVMDEGFLADEFAKLD